MNLRNRIKKIEGQLNADDSFEDAMALLSIYIQTGECSSDIDIEAEARKLAEQGIGLTKVLDDIAAAGPSRPLGENLK